MKEKVFDLVINYVNNNFTKKILFISKDEQENCEKEKYYIQYYNAIQSEQYYNIASGGQGGYVLAGRTPEEKKKVYQKIKFQLLKWIRKNQQIK